MNNRNIKDYLLQNYYELMQELRDRGLSFTEISRQIIDRDVQLTGFNPDRLRKSVKRALVVINPSEITGKSEKPFNVMVYDIETSRNLAEVWNTGKTYIGHTQLIGETNIITVAWKWLGDNKIHYLKWEKDSSDIGGNDKQLMDDFLPHYNKADMVIGWNNNNFDNKLVNTRALKHRFFVNTLIKSYDVMVQVKRIFRQPSNSMAWYAKFLGLGGKLQHSGLKMWQDIQWGEESDSKEAMDLMIKYNLQDVSLTEEIYTVLRPYLGSVVNKGAFVHGVKTLCPNCGKNHIKLFKTTATTAGTIQRMMRCDDCDTQFKMSNTAYLKTLGS